jgi:hypothetical protein
MMHMSADIKNQYFHSQTEHDIRIQKRCNSFFLTDKLVQTHHRLGKKLIYFCACLIEYYLKFYCLVLQYLK